MEQNWRHDRSLRPPALPRRSVVSLSACSRRTSPRSQAKPLDVVHLPAAFRTWAQCNGAAFCYLLKRRSRRLSSAWRPWIRTPTTSIICGPIPHSSWPADGCRTPAAICVPSRPCRAWRMLRACATRITRGRGGWLDLPRGGKGNARRSNRPSALAQCVAKREARTSRQPSAPLPSSTTRRPPFPVPAQAGLSREHLSRAGDRPFTRGV